MSRATFSSASGLRPMSAFVVVAGVVAAVAGRVTHLTAQRAADQPSRLRTELGADPAYAITDVHGRTLARFVPRFDLELSPRSMWQAHTPEVIAREVSAVLGGVPSAEELMQAFLPDARGGVIEVDAWDLAPRQAHRLAEWIDHGLALAARSTRRSGSPPLQGIWLEEKVSGTSRVWRVAWKPTVLLSVEERTAHGARSAWSWARSIASGIDTCLRESVARVPPGSRIEEERLRSVWSALLPTAYERALEGIAADRVLELHALLEREGVAPWQMRIAFSRQRSYPAGKHELYGNWGFTRPEQSEAAPREGLELACDRLLAEPVWNDRLVRSRSRYASLQDRTVRGERANGYAAFDPPSPVPLVQTTLDLGLQAFVHAALEELFEKHRPAIAMALVGDVRTGEVLALDSVEEYPVAPFAPIYHVFTTGSTFKVLTMACALEEGVVRPDDRFDVGAGSYRVVYPDGRPSGRVIREAEHAPTGSLRAEDCFAFSVNAGLTQIGLRVRDLAFRGYLEKLGYGQKPGSGLGPERAGNLAPLPWSYAYTHTSVCFGHEISTTVWQHAAALATVLRGGIFRPLRLLAALEQGGERWELSSEAEERVFGEETCELVREMMRRGAREGTGKETRQAILRAAEATFGPGSPLAELDIGTKTGTAQKVPTEICVHVEMPARARWKTLGLPATKERIASLKEEAKPHGRCYTSSIVVFGRRPEQERELFVFVVAEEPRGKERFGSRVAGPTAAAILCEALGLTKNGEEPRREIVAGFAASKLEARNPHQEPWRASEVGW